MFWNKKKAGETNEEVPRRNPLLDPAIGNMLAPKSTPGYYPGFHTLDQKRYWDAATRKIVLERVNDTKPMRFFSAAEQLTMSAVVDRILPQEDRVDANRIPILPGIDDRLYSNRIEGYRYEDMPSDQEAYCLCAKTIEAMAHELYNKPFYHLRTLDQEIILQSLHDEKPLVAKELWRQMNLKRFWSMLVSDCCAVYYAHPYAWDEIGFGGPAYPRGYMRLEGGEAEPWEVDEQRYDWLAPDDTISDQLQESDSQDSSHYGQAGTH